MTMAAPLVAAALARLGRGGSADGAGKLHLPRLAYALLALAMIVGVVPAVSKALGWSAALALGVGAGVAFLATRLRGEAPFGTWLLAIGIGGATLHSFLDGAMLFSFGEASATRVLAPLVLLDRVTLGLAAWALLLATFGRGVAMLGLVAIAASTALGYVAVEFVTTRLADDTFVAWVNAALAGVLIWLVAGHALRRPWRVPPDRRLPRSGNPYKPAT